MITLLVATARAEPVEIKYMMFGTIPFGKRMILKQTNLPLIV